MHGRVAAQISRAHRDGNLTATLSVDLGYRKQFVSALMAEQGVDRAAADAVYARATGYVADVIGAGVDSFGTVEGMTGAIERGLNHLVK